MKKYIITDAVDTSLIKPENVLWPGAAVAAVAFGFVPVVGFVPWTTTAVARAMRDRSVTKITTVDELCKYHNCISNEWKTKVLYVEHPHRKGVLIEAALYKDYILREMVADVSNYIMDHLDLSKLVVGLIVSDNGNAKVKVPVEQVNAEAAIKCSLNKNYLFSVCDTHAVPTDGAKYIWISQFPDIIAAVRHGSGKMEVRKKIALDLDVGVGAGKASANADRKKEHEFYISYSKQND